MSCLPPRKVSVSGKTSKKDVNPLNILLQIGFSKRRALKALAATGNRSVQLASDWLLTHVNDSFLDTEAPREYILYACPMGCLLEQLHEFWTKSKEVGGWNGAHNLPPHIRLVSFFKAADEYSLELTKSVKQVFDLVGDPPDCSPQLEPYVSYNFMGLFLTEEHAEYLKKIAVQYVKQVLSPEITLEPHIKSLHITLAYNFNVSAYDALKELVDGLQLQSGCNWELRLYSRDPRFASHQVHKVTQDYTPKENDELELVMGDYIYIAKEQLDSSPDGWVQGTSWLTGVTGYLPAVYTQRTAESDAWTLHRAMSLNGNTTTDIKSESDSTTDGENGASVVRDEDMARERSEDFHKEWELYWKRYIDKKTENVLTEKDCAENGNKVNGCSETDKNNADKSTGDSARRWLFAMRHGERVDLTYGSWVPFCFDENDKYVRKDLNMPIRLPQRAGGKTNYALDSPLTRVGRLQGYLVGEGLRLANVKVAHVYSSVALRSIETAQAFLEGLQAGPNVKIRVEPGLFEYLSWYHNKVAQFMTPLELQKAGYNIDTNYKPYIEDLTSRFSETVEEFYKRAEKVMHSAYKDTEAEGGNILFVGHAITLDTLWQTMRRYDNSSEAPPYAINKHLLRVPYCALAAVRDKPLELVPPPCPPSINSCSARFDWKILYDV